MRRQWILGAAVGLSLAGCPEESSPNEEENVEDAATSQPDGGGAGGADAGASEAGTSDAGASDAGASDPSKKVGTFTIKLTAPTPASGSSAASPGYTSIGGKVFNKPVPEEIIWEADQQQGGCKLVKPRVPFCETPCSGGVCVADDQCAANAEPQSVGTVTISGLRQASGTPDIKIDPLGTDPNARVYSTPGEVELPYPAFAEGDEIKLQAAGGMVSGFSMAAKGIAPLELTTTSFPLKTGTALALAWKAPSKPDVGRIAVKLDISHHGGTKGKIECDVPDTGSLEVPAAQVTRLLALGVAGFPTITLTRISKASAQTSVGPVELQIVEEVERAVQIDGLMSCSGDSDCAAGKKCQADLSCK